MEQKTLKSGYVELRVSDPENILYCDGNPAGADARRARVAPENINRWSEGPAPKSDDDLEV